MLHGWIRCVLGVVGVLVLRNSSVVLILQVHYRRLHIQLVQLRHSKWVVLVVVHLAVVRRHQLKPLHHAKQTAENILHHGLIT